MLHKIDCPKQASETTACCIKSIVMAGSTRRRHMFLLQGWKEVCEELEREGIRAVCHVARPGRRNPSYMTMACRAALVVSEEPFTNPLLEDAR